MKTAQAAYRPRIQNGSVNERYAKPVAKPRRAVATRQRVLPQQQVSSRLRRRTVARPQAAPLPNGLNVLGLLLVAGAAIGLMLVVALGWQRNAYGLAQQEVEMRSALDQVSDERQQLTVEHRRALNPRATTALSDSAGLTDLKLDQRTASAVSAKATAKKTPAGKESSSKAGAKNAAVKPATPR